MKATEKRNNKNGSDVSRLNLKQIEGLETDVTETISHQIEILNSCSSKIVEPH